MGRPPITEAIVDRTVLAMLRVRLRRRANAGYTDVPVHVPTLERLLELAGKGLRNEN